MEWRDRKVYAAIRSDASLSECIYIGPSLAYWTNIPDTSPTLASMLPTRPTLSETEGLLTFIRSCGQNHNSLLMFFLETGAKGLQRTSFGPEPGCRSAIYGSS